ncbi:MAG: hypothetical protein ACLGHP_10125, partial [Vicinamibacteria bacterium]
MIHRPERLVLRVAVETAVEDDDLQPQAPGDGRKIACGARDLSRAWQEAQHLATRARRDDGHGVCDRLAGRVVHLERVRLCVHVDHG